MAIPRLTADAPLDALAEALDRAGCLVVTEAADASIRDSVRDELAPHMATVRVIRDDDPAAFYPGNTRRVTALVARSETARTLVAHPTSRGICERFLVPNGEFGYQLHVTAALDVGPGARTQLLHREEDSYTFFPPPRPNLIVASMWAVTDFTANNGATLLVPGSHRWDADRKASPGEIVSAEMSAGSVLFWLGGTLHGAGANTSEEWRYGIILTYSCGWLRQEENQYLDVPPELAEKLDPELRSLLGFDMYGGLGFSDPRVRNEV